MEPRKGVIPGGASDGRSRVVFNNTTAGSVDSDMLTRRRLAGVVAADRARHSQMPRSLMSETS